MKHGEILVFVAGFLSFVSTLFQWELGATQGDQVSVALLAASCWNATFLNKCKWFRGSTTRCVSPFAPTWTELVFLYVGVRGSFSLSLSFSTAEWQNRATKKVSTHIFLYFLILQLPDYFRQKSRHFEAKACWHEITTKQVLTSKKCFCLFYLLSK